MKLSEIQIENYKGFRQSGPCAVGEKFTVVVGQNSVGKSAFLEAFRLNRNDQLPYRGPSTPRNQPVYPHYVFSIKGFIPGHQIKSAILTQDSFWVAVPQSLTAQDRTFIEDVFETGLNFTLKVGSSIGFDSVDNTYGKYSADVPRKSFQYRVKGDAADVEFAAENNTFRDDLPGIIGNALGKWIYSFKAERMSIDSWEVNNDSQLQPDARNLPAALHNFQSDPHGWKQYLSHIFEIFPSIKAITTPPSGSNGQVTISLMSVSPEIRRPDLSVLLKHAGTGVGQVLAILYVAMNHFDSVVIIDEPNSFLHPGAAKKLIQILKQYESNQYIISTHSADLITTINPEIIHLIEWDGEQSIVKTLDHKRLDDMALVLETLGARLSDVFGADNIIWVEGPTEAACFPKLLKKERGISFRGTAFVALRNTGDLEVAGLNGQMAFDVYRRLTSGPSLFPPALAFSLDLDDRTEREQEDLTRQSDGLIRFLPRRELENYFLHGLLLRYLLNRERQAYKICGEISLNETEAALQAAMSKNSSGADASLNNEAVLANCKGAKILSSVFAQFELSYSKTRHGPDAIDWLLENDPVHIKELILYVESLCGITE